ncbi:MAG: hypothetical protein HC772_09025 [Leptolyngbyaceae cyanobacterium CRU_2_3]|nr:hypothetical protein [Leptolyngbyaceae cyanobacterium CRU_2_3]
MSPNQALTDRSIQESIADTVASLLRFQGIEIWEKRSPVETPSADLRVILQLDAAHPDNPDLNGIAVFYPSHLQSARLAQLLHKTILRTIDIRSQGVQSVHQETTNPETANPETADPETADPETADLETSQMTDTGIPTVYLTVGFVGGREDSINLGNAEYRDCMAQAIATGILKYIQTAL